MIFFTSFFLKRILSVPGAGSTFARRARLNADAGPEAAALVNGLGAATLPTFVFFCNGQIVDKYSGHDRLELMNRCGCGGHVIRVSE